MHFIVGNCLLEDVTGKIRSKQHFETIWSLFLYIKDWSILKLVILGQWTSKTKKLSKLNKQSLRFQHHHVAQSLWDSRQNGESLQKIVFPLSFLFQHFSDISWRKLHFRKTPFYSSIQWKPLLFMFFQDSPFRPKFFFIYKTLRMFIAKPLWLTYTPKLQLST